MATCINCNKKTGMNNPAYYLDSDQTMAICHQCYQKLEHFKIKHEFDSVEEFDDNWKIIEEELMTHNFTDVSKEFVAKYLHNQRSKLEAKARETRKQALNLEDLKNHLLTTGYNFEGYQITDYLGVISGQSALGTGAFSGISAGVNSFLGTESSYYGMRLIEAKESATKDMILYSIIKEANAIIGIDFDYIIVDGLISVIANGTAVKIKKINDI